MAGAQTQNVIARLLRHVANVQRQQIVAQEGNAKVGGQRQQAQVEAGKEVGETRGFGGKVAKGAHRNDACEKGDVSDGIAVNWPNGGGGASRTVRVIAKDIVLGRVEIDGFLECHWKVVHKQIPNGQAAKPVFR